MSRTFTPLTGDGTGDSFDVGGKFGYQSAEKIRQALDIFAYNGFHPDLGGHPAIGYVTGAATWLPVDAGKAFTIDGDQLNGLTLEVVVTYKTENAGQAVQVRIRNTTDGSNAALGTSSTSTSWVPETLTLTLASGNKSYRMEILGGAIYAVFAVGYWRVRKVPA